jgi:hypothetical protein
MNENITHAVAASVATLLAQHGEVLAKLAALDALCEQQTRTIALTSERAVKAEKACDEVGIQLAAAQARLRLAMAVVDAARGVTDGPLSDALRALDAVPGDALATP